MYCSKCGTMIPDGAAFCPGCGQPVIAPALPAPGISAAPAIAAPIRPTPAYSPSIYAGFWLRFVAAIIDGVVLSIPLVPIFFLLFASLIPTITSGEDPMDIVTAALPRIALFVLVSVAGSWLYWALFESSTWQATLGKRALGLYVTDISGNRATFSRASGRFFAGRGLGYVPSIGGLYFLASCICAGVTEKKQALHDMIAGCLVLRKS